MKLLWFKKITRRPRTRLKSKSRNGTGVIPGRWMSRPSGIVLAWFLLWATTMTLRVLDWPAVPDKLAPDGRMPVTIHAAVDFLVGDDLNSTGVRKVAAGTRLAEQGQTLDASTMEVLLAYRRTLSTRAGRMEWIVRRVGDGLILLFGLLAACLVLGFSRVPDADYGRNIFLMWMLALCTLLPSQWLMQVARYHGFFASGDVLFLLPLAMAPLMTAILLGALPAAALCFWVAFSAAVLADYNLMVLVLGIAQGMVAVRFARVVRSRKMIFRLGILAGAAGAAGALGFGLLTHQFGETLLKNCLFSLGSGVLASLATLLLLPLLEMLFGIATDISLLELADMEHPLLKRLAIEAPGTYQHSLMVANLAQAGVAALGGNTLRTRICAYFHDIGKLVKPGFFSENIQFTENPHDDLTPRMSFLVIVSHVKEGVSLALQHKLPRPVLDAIEQHHGTGMVAYFYHKAAKSGQDAATRLCADDFRYPGPKPREREAVVLSLADSIEAASRSLEKMTPASIAGLVNDIVEERMRDGQLDDAPLTMSEISQLKQKFIFTLTNMLHGRISYPGNENRNKSETKSDQDKPAAVDTFDETPDAVRRED